MRTLLSGPLLCVALAAHAQLDMFTGHYAYTFVEDSRVLVPLRGSYTVEFLARGQWWSYMDPRLPVDYPGARLTLKSVFPVGGEPLLLVDVPKDYSTTDQKLRVVRGADTVIVDLDATALVEERMRARMALAGERPRPPVVLPFRKGWHHLDTLLNDADNAALTYQLDGLWREHRTEVLAAYDTARHTFSLLMDALRKWPATIFIIRDPNYRRHLLQFPASGPGTRFELYRQDSTGTPSSTSSLRVDMPADGETPTWVDITDLPFGKYSAYLRWGDTESLFFLINGW